MSVKPQFIPYNYIQDNQDVQKHDLLTNQASAIEQDSMLSAVGQDTPPSVTRAEDGNLARLVQRAVASGLARLQDPQPEGLDTRGLRAVKPGTSILGLLPILALTSTLGALIVSFSYYLSPFGDVIFEIFFFLGLLLIFLPILVRLMSAAPSQFERLCLLCIAGLCLYLVQLMVNPLRVTAFDEFLHWRTADDILRTRHLFSVNSMLPVSPYYPGLEIVTNALSTISGLSTFYAGVLVVSAARLLMTISLFLFYEHITNSSRMAGIATIIYMANPHFITFDVIFSYESLALPLATFMFYILVRYQTPHKDYRWTLFIASFVLLSVSVTHHMTDYIFDGLLVLWFLISLFQPASRNVRRNLAIIALFAVFVSVVYIFLMPGNPVWQYLSSYFTGAFDELGQIIAGTSAPRQLFVNQAINPTPIWDELLMMASVAIIAFSLPFGLFSILRQHRHNALAVMLGIAALAYPVSQAFRFTVLGPDITDRAAAFLFLPIAYVLTVFITHFWPTRKLSWRATSLITCALVVVFMGGILLGSGPNWSNLPGPYKIEADSRSIEAQGIQAATWSLTYLGPNNRVATDRTNQMLMSTYGDQRIVNDLEDGANFWLVFYASQFGPDDIALLRQEKIRYLVVDLRLSTALPLVGYYFQENEPGSHHLTSPISRQALTKFDAIPHISRVFDSGDIVIYDLAALIDGA